MEVVNGFKVVSPNQKVEGLVVEFHDTRPLFKLNRYYTDEHGEYQSEEKGRFDLFPRDRSSEELWRAFEEKLEELGHDTSDVYLDESVMLFMKD